jgi:predicted KAP-like P-loop ATPase
MVIEEIEKSIPKEDDKPIVIYFNPWYFSDQQQLITQFFNKLSMTLDREDRSEKYVKIGKAIQTYSDFFVPLLLPNTLCS